MNFKNYCKNNQVIKSITFELIPIGRTRQSIEEQNVIPEDNERKGNAVLVKEVSDSFIREFLADYSAKYDWEKLSEAYENREGFNELAEKRKEQISKDLLESYKEYLIKFAEENGIQVKIDNWNCAAYIDRILPAYADIHPVYSNETYRTAIESLSGCTTSVFKKYMTGYEKILAGVRHGSYADRTIENFQTVLQNRREYQKTITLIDEIKEFNSIVVIQNMNTYMSQSGIDEYNEIIGDKFDKDGNVVRYGINHYINQYNQQQMDKRNKLPKFQKLKKQILSDASPAFTIDVISNKEEMLTLLENIRRVDRKLDERLGKILNGLCDGTYPLDGVLLKPKSRNNVANQLTKEWSYFADRIRKEEEEKIKAKYFEKRNRIKEKLTQKEEDTVSDIVNQNACSISYLNHMLTGVTERTVQGCILDNYMKNHAMKEADYSKMSAMPFMKNDIMPTAEEVISIQKYLDCVIEETRTIKMFFVNMQDTSVDAFFAEEIQEVSEPIRSVVKAYNMIRNFLTKKHEKNAKERRVQLCFGRPAHYEQKWANSQEGKFGNTDAAILEKDGDFFYIVPAAKNTGKLNFPVTENPLTADDYNYLLTKKCLKLAMALPKATFKSPEAMEKYKETEEPFKIPVGDSTMTVSKKMYDDYNAKVRMTVPDEKNKLIEYAKEFLAKNSSFKKFNWSWLRPAEEYRTYGEFCEEVDSAAFEVLNCYVSKDLVDRAVESGNLYMFKISSQDMYKSRDRMKNCTSLRFNGIIDCMKNGSNEIIINNAPQIYYRPKLIEASDKHPVGSRLVNKLTTDGKTIPGDIYLELNDYYNGKGKVLSPEAAIYNERIVVKDSDRAHIKDRHYTREMFTITMSYTLQKSIPREKTVYQLNEEVRKDIMENGCNIMSIIRGLDNLLYYVIINNKGEKLEAGDLNTVGGTDYYEKLSVIGAQRKADQKSWKYEKKVSDIKDAYLGQICRKIAKIAVRNNAVIVIDKISEGTKRKKAAFDNNVYRKFENALVNTLNNYYDVTLGDREAGGVLNPLQLTAPDDNAYQNGIIFYQFDSFTKSICPETGFANLLNTYNIKTVKSKVEFLKKFTEIRYDECRDEFAFDFSWKDLGCTLKSDELPLYEGLTKQWTVYTHLTRYKRHDNGYYEEIDGTKILKDTVRRRHPDMIGKSINVDELSTDEIHTVYEVFAYYVNGYIPRMNQEDSGYISPVCRWSSYGNVAYDEMAAYRLAQKGLLSMMKIMDGKEGKDINVSRVEWLNFLVKENNTSKPIKAFFKKTK